MENNNVEKMYEEWDVLLKEELKKADDQIKAYHMAKMEEIIELWELRKDILSDINFRREEINKEENSFLEDELKRVDSQIRAYHLGGPKGNVNKVKELLKLRKDIIEEIKNIIGAERPKIRVV